jgi:uncharacterized protein (TIGR03067 family)
MKSLSAFAPAVLLSVALVCASAQEKKAAKLDPAKLVGTWTYVSGVREGKKVSDDRLVGKVQITKDTITVPSGDPKKPFIIGYKLNAKASPATIDMAIKDGPVQEGKALGLIALDGDELKLCYVAVMDKDAKRPAKLESTKDNKAFYFVLKREKK